MSLVDQFMAFYMASTDHLLSLEKLAYWQGEVRRYADSQLQDERTRGATEALVKLINLRSGNVFAAAFGTPSSPDRPAAGPAEAGAQVPPNDQRQGSPVGLGGMGGPEDEQARRNVDVAQ